jgi:hypothetical protein
MMERMMMIAKLMKMIVIMKISQKLAYHQ